MLHGSNADLFFPLFSSPLLSKCQNHKILFMPILGHKRRKKKKDGIYLPMPSTNAPSWNSVNFLKNSKKEVIFNSIPLNSNHTMQTLQSKKSIFLLVSFFSQSLQTSVILLQFTLPHSRSLLSSQHPLWPLLNIMHATHLKVLSKHNPTILSNYNTSPQPPCKYLCIPPSNPIKYEYSMRHRRYDAVGRGQNRVP